MAVIYFEKVDKTKTKRKMAFRRRLYKGAFILSAVLNIALIAYIVLK